MNQIIATVSAAMGGAASIEELLTAIKGYKLGDDQGPLNNLENTARGSVGNEESRKAVAAALAAFLSSDATREAKVFASRQLVACGGPEIGASVAPLLLNIDTSNFTRYAIEQIPGQEIDGVLIDALGKADEASKLGIVNTLGARHAASAVPVLSALLMSDDTKLAEAAAAALGRIGGADAVEALGGKVARGARDTAANALLVTAESAAAAGDADLAKRAYKEAAGAGSKQAQRAAKEALRT